MVTRWVTTGSNSLRTRLEITVTIARVLLATAAVLDHMSFLFVNSVSSTTGAVIRVVNRLFAGDVVVVVGVGPREAWEFPQEPDVPPAVSPRREEETVSSKVSLNHRRHAVPSVTVRVLNQNVGADF